ncbi:MAG: serine/threonine-protein kinase [Acidobacteriota bacterium]
MRSETPAPESPEYRRVVELVDAALDLDTSERRAFLDQVCEGRPELRVEIDSLLEQEAEIEDDFLEVPAARQAVGLLNDDTLSASGNPEPEAQPEARPEAVGPYRVLEELGRGGMGTVYLAEQSAPIERRVALKVIHRFEGDQGARRFAAECQALARLKHPNIAAVHDAGVADDGRAFVAMEWVEGSHITDWCDRNRLPISARIELFLGVCAGVGHAHQKGLMHRDLKPSNVLVAEVDGQATAKVIDFGIARTVDQVEATPVEGPISDVRTGAVRSLGHSISMLMGSPMYMSPEAARLDDRSDVDTRTDVYSLGVLLYELLIGVLPRDISELGIGALLHQARTTDPPPPSRRWAELTRDRREALAELRRTGASALERRLRGDLDAILTKATARNREERYGTVPDLAADLRGTLEHRPVLARDPFLGYHFSRFVRRNLGALATMVVVIGLLVAGVVARTREAQRANLEAERANMEAERANLETARARQALAEAEQLSEFLIGLFEVVDPDRGDDDPQSVDELLAKAEASMAEELADQPLARARFMQTIGRITMNRMELDRAATLYEQALALREEHGPTGDSDLITTVGSLGVIYRRQGRLEDAEAMAIRAVELNDAATERDPARLSATLTWLANLHISQKQYEAAVAGHRRALEIRRRELPDDLGAAAESLNNLGVALRNLGRFAEARPILQEAESLFAQAFGPDHPWVVGCWLNLAGIEEALGRWQEAETLLMRASETWNELHGPVHTRTLLARRALGALWSRWHRTDEAIDHLSRLLAQQRSEAGSDRLEIAQTLIELGGAHHRQQNLDRAQEMLEEALAITADHFGGEHRLTHRSRAFLALVAWDRGQVSEAAEAFEHLATETQSRYGESHPLSAWMLTQLGMLRMDQGRLDEAEASLLEARAIYETLYDVPSVLAARTLFQIGRLYRLRGRREEASDLLQRALETLESTLPAGHPELTEARAEIADSAS